MSEELNKEDQIVEEEVFDEDGDLVEYDMEQVLEDFRQAALNIIKEKHPELEGKIEEFKKNYGDVYVYMFTDDEFYIYRPITRFEYKELTKGIEDYDEAAEKIVMKSVLYPTITDSMLNTLKAGIIPTLLELILDASGFGVKNPVIQL